MFNKPINHDASVLEGKIKLSSAKMDGTDPETITGVSIVKVTSLNLLYLSYDTELSSERKILFESLEGFKLVSEEANNILSELGT